MLLERSPLGAQEFCFYLVLVIYMWLVGAKTIADYWAKKTLYSSPFLWSVMSRPRFQVNSWNLHLCDAQGDEQNSRKTLQGKTYVHRHDSVMPDILLTKKTAVSRWMNGGIKSTNRAKTVHGLAYWRINQQSGDLNSLCWRICSVVTHGQHKLSCLTPWSGTTIFFKKQGSCTRPCFSISLTLLWSKV